jgi:hypothetical protein
VVRVSVSLEYESDDQQGHVEGKPGPLGETRPPVVALAHVYHGGISVLHAESVHGAAADRGKHD